MLVQNKLTYIFLYFLLSLALIGCQLRVDEKVPTEVPIVGLEEVRPLPTATPKQNEPVFPTQSLDTPVPLTSPVPTLSQPTSTATPEPLFPVYEGAPLATAGIGIQVHIHHEDLVQIMAHLSDLRVGWVKVQVSWKLYEPAPGNYAPDRFAELDQFVSLANEQEIDVLIGVAKAPEWSRPTTEMDGPPQDFALFRQFTNYLAGRYAGKVAAYELWNETNLRREWNGQPLSATEFVRLAILGAEGIRTADPAAIIIAGAPAPTGINDGEQAIDDRIFFAGMVASGLGEHVDAFGVHPYGWANPPESNFGQHDPKVSSHQNHPSFFFLATLGDYQKILQDFGVEKPLWVTEYGWGSFENIFTEEGDQVEPPIGVEFMRDVSEWEQAQYIQKALEIGQTYPDIGPLFLWNLNFGPLLGTAYSETGFSILRPDGSPRPAYYAISALPRL